MRTFKPIGASENSDAAGPDSDVISAIVMGGLEEAADAEPGLSANREPAPTTAVSSAVVENIPNPLFMVPSDWR